jgi:hypothetical protein
MLADGIESLPLGRSLMWPLGEAFKLMNERVHRHTSSRLRPSGLSGPVPALSYIVDMADWRGTLYRSGEAFTS